MLTKQQILEALRQWVNQRPGLEFGNYGDWAAYRSELRQITKDRKEALELLRAVEWRDSITAEDLIAAFPHAYSGRLAISEVPGIGSTVAYGDGLTAEITGRKGSTLRAKTVQLNGDYTEDHDLPLAEVTRVLTAPSMAMLSYCTGQYWPTEYRKAAAAVLASVLWDRARADMPAPLGKVKRTSGKGPFAIESEHDSIEGLSPGDWLRRYFRREFGRGIQARWFD